MSPGLEHRGSALTCIELSSISRGLVALDAMIKRAPSDLLYQGRYSTGRYLILMDGDVASVEESYEAGLEAGDSAVIHHVFLPAMHSKLRSALQGHGESPQGEPLLMLETTSVAAAIGALDQVLKLIEASVVDFQLGPGIGGKGYFAVEAPLHDLQAACSELECTIPAEFFVDMELLPRPHIELLASFRMKHPFGHPWCRDV